MIAKQNRATKAKPKNKRARQRERVVVAESLRKRADLAQLFGVLTAAAGGDTIHSQASLLSDRRFPVVQQQALAAQTGRRYGNRHLQHVMASSKDERTAFFPAGSRKPLTGATTHMGAGQTFPTVGTRTVQRQVAKPGSPSSAGPAAGKRKDYVFIMGQDPEGSKNKFYTAAGKYFAAKLPTATIVRDKRNLADVFAYLSAVTKPVGNLYLVSHAAADGTLGFALTASDKDTKITYGELKTAVKSSPDIFKLSGQIDARTTIHIKGCNIGRSRKMVELVDEAFGGLGKVIAPTHKQRYEWKGKGISPSEVFELFRNYFIERPGLVKLTSSQKLKAFSQKYSHLTVKKWKQLVKGAKRKVHKTSSFTHESDAPFKKPMKNAKAVVAYANKNWFLKKDFKATKLLSYQPKDTGKDIDHVYRFQVKLKDGKSGTAWHAFSVPKPDTVIQEAKKKIEPTLARPKMYRWNVKRTAKGMNLFFTAFGQMTEYFIRAKIRSKKGKYLRPKTSEKTYHTISK